MTTPFAGRFVSFLGVWFVVAAPAAASGVKSVDWRPKGDPPVIHVIQTNGDYADAKGNVRFRVALEEKCKVGRDVHTAFMALGKPSTSGGFLEAFSGYTQDLRSNGGRWNQRSHFDVPVGKLDPAGTCRRHAAESGNAQAYRQSAHSPIHIKTTVSYVIQCGTGIDDWGRSTGGMPYVVVCEAPGERGHDNRWGCDHDIRWSRARTNSGSTCWSLCLT